MGFNSGFKGLNWIWIEAVLRANRCCWDIMRQSSARMHGILVCMYDTKLPHLVLVAILIFPQAYFAYLLHYSTHCSTLKPYLCVWIQTVWRLHRTRCKTVKNSVRAALLQKYRKVPTNLDWNMPLLSYFARSENVCRKNSVTLSVINGNSLTWKRKK